MLACRAGFKFSASVAMDTIVRNPTIGNYSTPAKLSGTSIDVSRPFILEEFTPLFHTPEYHTLPHPIRLRYNQLHALYFNEQVAFFEQEMLSHLLRALLSGPLPRRIIESVRQFFDEEQKHTVMFRALNKRCAPQFYANADYYFVRTPSPVKALLAQMARRPRLFPLFVWLALLQEERSLYYSKGCVERAAELDSHFVAYHKAHLDDEVCLVGWDEDLLDWLWPQARSLVRIVNARLLTWMVDEFFYLPKRSGLRVVAQIAHEFPQLHAAPLYRAIGGLRRNISYRNTIYSRKIIPRSFARFEAYPEFAALANLLQASPGACL